MLCGVALGTEIILQQGVSSYTGCEDARMDTTNPNDNNGGVSAYLSSTSTFTFGLSAGIKYMFTSHIGLRVQSQLLMPVYYGGYYGYGYGGYSKVVAMLNFSGGLIFAFGDRDTTTTFD